MNANRLAQFIWFVLVVVLMVALVEAEEDSRHLRAHIHLLTQACDGK